MSISVTKRWRVAVALVVAAMASLAAVGGYIYLNIIRSVLLPECSQAALASQQACAALSLTPTLIEGPCSSGRPTPEWASCVEEPQLTFAFVSKATNSPRSAPASLVNTPPPKGPTACWNGRVGIVYSALNIPPVDEKDAELAFVTLCERLGANR